MIGNELVVQSEIVQQLEIKYNKKEIESFINILESNYSGLLVTKDSVSDIKDTLSKINKIIKSLKDYRIDNTKRAMKPLENFTNDFKSYEKRLEIVYRDAKNQLDEIEERELKEQFNIMQDIKIKLCTEQNINEYLIPFVELPEQKNDLSRSKFNEKKAAELIQLNIDKVLEDYKVIEKAVETTNAKSNTDLKADDYIKYINDISKALQEVMNDEIKYIQMQERIRIEEEKKAKEKAEKELNVKNEINAKFEEKIEEITNTSSDIKNEPTEPQKQAQNLNDKKIQLLISLSQNEIEKAKLLKRFLDDNEITYEKI